MMSCDTCFTRGFKDPAPFDLCPTLSASRSLDTGFSDGRIRVESSCLGLGDLADIKDTEGEEPSATDLTVDPPNVGFFLGLLLTPVMLLRFPMVRVGPGGEALEKTEE